MDDLWKECIDPKSKPRIRDKQAAADTRRWKTELEAALGEKYSKSDRPRRREEACEIAAWATEVWIHHVHAGRKRSYAHNAQRLAAGGTAAVAAGSGAALAVGLSGTSAKWWGIIVVFLAIGSGAVAAIWPETEYERNRDKARQFEWLWREMWTYATEELPSIPVANMAGKRKEFSNTMTTIAKTAGP